MNVSDIMRRSCATIKPDAPLLEAADLLLQTNQRGLPVIDREGTLVGVISEGDFLHRTKLDISPPPGNFLEELLGIDEDTPARRRMRACLVRETMTRDPVCVDDEASLDQVVALIDVRHIAQLPVVCGGSVVGVVSRVELLAVVARALSSAPLGIDRQTRIRRGRTERQVRTNGVGRLRNSMPLAGTHAPVRWP
jgi:CBS domain-containing protein